MMLTIPRKGRTSFWTWTVWVHLLHPHSCQRRARLMPKTTNPALVARREHRVCIFPHAATRLDTPM